MPSAPPDTHTHFLLLLFLLSFCQPLYFPSIVLCVFLLPLFSLRPLFLQTVYFLFFSLRAISSLTFYFSFVLPFILSFFFLPFSPLVSPAAQLTLCFPRSSSAQSVGMRHSACKTLDKDNNEMDISAAGEFHMRTKGVCRDGLKRQRNTYPAMLIRCLCHETL